MDYLTENAEHWNRRHTGSGKDRYLAENVESYVFRTYGRIFRYELGLTGEQHERLLDFGCGEGAVSAFFAGKGFDVYGVDISEDAIAACRSRMGTDRFRVIPPVPKEDDVFFEGVTFDSVVAIESLYYLSPADIRTRLLSFRRQMRPGGVLFATMHGTKSYYFEHAEPLPNGMHTVRLNTPRLQISDYCVTFMESREHLVETFSPFTPLHVGYVQSSYRKDEGLDFTWIFVGQAPE